MQLCPELLRRPTLYRIRQGSLAELAGLAIVRVSAAPARSLSGASRWWRVNAGSRYIYKRALRLLRCTATTYSSSLNHQKTRYKLSSRRRTSTQPMMQAAVHVPSTPVLKLDNHFEIPKPGPDQVLIKVQASGICHSDVFLLSQFPDDPRTYIMGHEVSGIAVDLGSNVKDIVKDKRYAVMSIGGCVSCLAKGSSGPLSLPLFGVGSNGGHAEYTVVDASTLVPVPDNVLPEQAAVAADAGTTAWHAVKTTAGIKKGDKVMITGIGGLGLFAVQYAVYLGAEVYAVDMRPSSRELAIKFGAKQAYDLPELDAALQNGFSVDVAIDFVTTDTTFKRDYSAVNKKVFSSELTVSGRIVIVGLSDQNLVINGVDGLLTGIHVLFSLYGLRSDLVEVLDLISKGHIKTVIDKRPLHEVNEAYDDLRANRILSRAVVIPPAFWKDGEN
ncbi:chaperonin 10-like protein [Cytidiella melzeri]|nr:chaperonin 10-like protein [Cytidiella melzeri]